MRPRPRRTSNAMKMRKQATTYVTLPPAVVAVELPLTRFRTGQRRGGGRGVDTFHDLLTTQRLLDHLRQEQPILAMTWSSSHHLTCFLHFFTTSDMWLCLCGVEAARKRRMEPCFEVDNSCISILDTLAGSRYHTSLALDDGDARQAC